MRCASIAAEGAKLAKHPCRGTVPHVLGIGAGMCAPEPVLADLQGPISELSLAWLCHRCGSTAAFAVVHQLCKHGQHAMSSLQCCVPAVWGNMEEKGRVHPCMHSRQ